MKRKKYLCITIIAILLLLASCDMGEPTTSDVVNDSDTGNSFVEAPLIGSWQDENGYGYSLDVSMSEDSAECIFDISYMPYGGMYLEWVFSQETSFENNKFYYENGKMTYEEVIYDEGGDPTVESDVEEGVSGSISYDAELDILYWYDGSESECSPITFKRVMDSEEYDGYGDYNDYENIPPEDTQLSDDDLRQINSNSAWKVVDSWKYEYNKGKDRHSQIDNASLRLPLASIKRGSTTATITTEVEYWFLGREAVPLVLFIPF